MNMLPSNSDKLVASQHERVRPVAGGASQRTLEKNEVRDEVIACWCEALQLKPGSFSSSSGFLELGGYSIGALRLVDTLEKRIDVRVELDRVLSELSLDALLELVEGKLREPTEEASSGVNREIKDATPWEEGIL